MTAHGSEFDAHPELMLAVAADIADTIGRLADVLGEIHRAQVPAAALGRLGRPVATGCERVQTSAVQALTLGAGALDQTWSAVQAAARGYLGADDQTVPGYRRVGAQGGPA